MTYQFPPRLMQAKAAAHYLGLSPSKLRTLDLPCKRDGGNVLYDRTDLDAYADQLPYDGKDLVKKGGDEWESLFD